jgi:hypothetical protein
MHNNMMARLIGILVIALGLFGCFSSSVQPTPTRLPASIPALLPTSTPLPTDIPIVSLTIDEVCDHGEGKVETVGYLYLPPSVIVIGTTYHIYLVKDPQAAFTKENAIEILVKEGNGPNEMKPLPDNFTNSDLQVNTEDGSVATAGTQVRITASFLMHNPSGTGCSLGLVHFFVN